MTIDYGEGEQPAVYLSGADGEWVEIGHTAEGSLTLDEPDTDAMEPILPPRITTDEAEFLRTALRLTIDEYVLAPPPPGRRRDRPAWQSPYGPPTRHRR